MTDQGKLRSPFKNIGGSNIVSEADAQLIIRAARLAAGEEPGNTGDREDPLSVAAFQSSI